MRSISTILSSYQNSTLLEKVRFAMAKDSPLNIFYAAAKSKKPASPSLGSTNTAIKAPPAAPVRNIAIEAMLERMNDMRKEIDDKLEALMSTNGLSKDLLHQFLNNPQNFTKEQWEFLQQKNEEFSQKIWSTVEPAIGINSEGASKKIEAKTSYDNPTGPASSSPLPGRKSKFSGSRRNWIPTG